MPIIIAHMEDCAIAQNGALSISQIQTVGEQRVVGPPRPTICTCGGIQVDVTLHERGYSGLYELDIPMGGVAND